MNSSHTLRISSLLLLQLAVGWLALSEWLLSWPHFVYKAVSFGIESKHEHWKVPLLLYGGGLALGLTAVWSMVNQEQTFSCVSQSIDSEAHAHTIALLIHYWKGTEMCGAKVHWRETSSPTYSSKNVQCSFMKHVHWGQICLHSHYTTLMEPF